MKNPSIQNNTTEIEKLWTFLFKKYMISFNDENKTNNNFSKREEIEAIKNIYILWLKKLFIKLQTVKD